MDRQEAPEVATWLPPAPCLRTHPKTSLCSRGGLVGLHSLGSGQGPRRPVGVHIEIFFQKKYGGRGASGRRGDRPTTCTVPEASQERVRYASAPGCPGRRRASLALTDLHTDNSACAALRRNKQRLRYTYDALPPRVAGDLRGIHNWTRLRRRIDAGGPLAGPPSRPGAPKGLPCCSPEASGEQFLWYNGGFVNFAPQRDEVFDRDRRSSSIHNFT